jgi:N-acetylneuraminate lyase
VNLAAIEQYADVLVKNQVTGAFVCGTAGEGTSLTIAERKQVVAKWVEASKGRIQIIAHVGTNCLEDAKELARHAQEVKADAVAFVAPHYIRPDTVEALVDFTAEVAAASPELPFFYYHFPDITHVRFTAYSYLKVASKKIPNLQGVKFTHHDFYDFGLCINFEGGKYDILNGYEHVLLAGLSYGTPGCIGITFSLIGPQYAKIFKAWESGDIAAARKEHARGVEFYTVLGKYGLIRAHKAMLKIKGLDLGPVRLPLVDLTQTEVDAMVAELKQTELYKEYF